MKMNKTNDVELTSLSNEKIKNSDKIENVKQEKINLPDNRYGNNQNTLDYNIAIRNKPTGSLYAKIYSTGNQSINNSTATTLTGLNNKLGNSLMMLTADTITITQDGAYILNAYCFCGWSSTVIFRILKNGTSITPHIRLGTTSAGINTPILTAVELLVKGDALTIQLFQNSGVSQVVQSPLLSVIKI